MTVFVYIVVCINYFNNMKQKQSKKEYQAFMKRAYVSYKKTEALTYLEFERIRAKAYAKSKLGSKYFDSPQELKQVLDIYKSTINKAFNHYDDIVKKAYSDYVIKTAWC